MSRIGKKAIALPANVKVSVGNDRTVIVEAGSNRMSIQHRPEVTVKVDEEAKEVVVTRQDDERESRAYHGLTRALINNMITGVTTGFSKELEITGVGWTAQVQGKKVGMNVGFADTKYVPIPDGVTVEVNGNKLKVSGQDKQAVGQCAASIRATRKPEPYNGKGVKYADERIIRKAGKAFGGGG